MKQRFLLTFICCAITAIAIAQKQFLLKSPDGRVETIVQIGDKLTYSVSHDGQAVIMPSPISLSLSNGEVWGDKARLSGNKIKSVKNIIPSPFYRKSEINDEYNELILNFSGQWGVEFRAYNDGMAYRFVNHRKAAFTIQNEEAKFCLTNDAVAIVAPPNNNFSTNPTTGTRSESYSIEQQFTSSFENTYLTGKLSELDKFPERKGMPALDISWYDGLDNIPAVPEGYGVSELDPNIPSVAGGKLQPAKLNPGKEIYSKTLTFKGGSHGSTLSIIPEERAKDMASKLPEVPQSPSNHFANFLLGCKGLEKTRSPFSISGPLSQVFCLGVLAQWTGQKLLFDPEKKQITNNPLANQLLWGAVPRSGWEDYYKL